MTFVAIRTKTTRALAAFAGLLVVSGCSGGSGGSDVAAPTETEVEVSIVTEVSTTTTVPEATTTTTRAVNESERRESVIEFLDAAASNENCTSFECKTAEAAYSRYQNLYELVAAIPGDDIAPHLSAISSAWEAWNVCLSTAETRFERFDCAEESDMEQAITDLYAAFR